jgi:malonyl-CoA O-methyltransferase
LNNKISKKGNNILLNSYYKALDWIKKNTIPGRGIIVSSKRKRSYLEVTGYLIPTLIASGELDLAEKYAEFLSLMQCPNGSFVGPDDGREYIFDTGMALQGLLEASNHWQRFKTSVSRAAHYIISSIETDGRIPAIYGPIIPESIHIYILPRLVKAAYNINKPEYLNIVKKSLNYYETVPDTLKDSYLTHFLAYIIDGFIDMGESEFVLPTVRRIFASQKKDGSIPAFPNVKWICSTGTAQFAIIGYKLGMNREADKAVNYLCKKQNSSGGFYGSYGHSAKYFPNEEISWANKFFIDALHLKMPEIVKQHPRVMRNGSRE